MPSIDEVYAGNSLKAADLEGSDVTMTIASAEAKAFDDGNKIAITFLETEKTLICNKTNARRIASLHGKEFDKWHGKKITLYPDLVDFKGDEVEAIRVRATRAASEGKPKFLKGKDNGSVKEELDDEIPF